MGIGHTDQYFSYLYIDTTGEKSAGSSSFSENSGTQGGDSIPKEFGIWASHPKKWNGLIKEKRPLHRLWWKLRYGWDVRIVRREKLRQNINIIYPKEILAEISWPDTSGALEKVVLDTTDVFDEGYVPDSVYYIQNADSLAKSKKKKDNFPEPKWDQFMYELGFGDLLKQDSIDAANKALGDTTLVKLVRTTWWKFWLPKYLEVTKEQYEEAMMRAAMDTIPDSAKVAKQKMKLAKKEEKERLKREKEEEKQKLEEERKLREAQEQEEEGVDDW
ncbi:MAG: hypothetical protein OHK0038_04660 [Flammeovirgaceae bacterium]